MSLAELGTRQGAKTGAAARPATIDPEQKHVRVRGGDHFPVLLHPPNAKETNMI